MRTSCVVQAAAALPMFGGRRGREIAFSQTAIPAFRKGGIDIRVFGAGLGGPEDHVRYMRIARVHDLPLAGSRLVR